MKARPILFSGPMVRALLDGRKTQTRRVVKGVPSWDHYGRDIMDWGLSGIHQETYDPSDPIEGTDRWHLDVQTDVDDHSRRVIRCPYGAPGDLLIVREAHALVPASAYRMSEGVQQTINPADPYRAAIYAAGWDRSIPKWRPSIHMPRWASRLTLEITDVRVERLQDISESDALAEGVREPSLGGPLTVIDHGNIYRVEREHTNPLLLWRFLWLEINGSESWDANPWCWAISFTVHQQNVDALLRAEGDPS